MLFSFYYQGDLENLDVSTGIKHLKEQRNPHRGGKSLRQPRGAAVRGLKCNWKCREGSGTSQDDPFTTSFWHSFLQEIQGFAYGDFDCLISVSNAEFLCCCNVKSQI